MAIGFCPVLQGTQPYTGTESPRRCCRIFDGTQDRESRRELVEKNIIFAAPRDVSEHDGSTCLWAARVLAKGWLRDGSKTVQGFKCLVREVVRVDLLDLDGQHEFRCEAEKHDAALLRLSWLQRELWLVFGPKALDRFCSTRLLLGRAILSRMPMH